MYYVPKYIIIAMTEAIIIKFRYIVEYASRRITYIKLYEGIPKK